MFWVKIYKLKYSTICAICDEEVLGKRINFNGLEIVIKENFYKGELVDEKRAIEIMKTCNIGNLFGNKIVELAIKEGFVDRENVLVLNDILHAQFLK